MTPLIRLTGAVLLTTLGTGCAQAASDTTTSETTTETTTIAQNILPGNKAFKAPTFEDYEAVYTSQSATSGGFTIQARKSGNGKKVAMIDIIPMKDNIIVAQRHIDLKTFRSTFSAQPYFAWGAEFIVGQSNEDSYDWTRVPIGGGAPKRMSGKIANKGYMTEMFSPTLAALMPMDVGTTFNMPEAYARKGEYVSSELDTFTVMKRENLTTPSGQTCQCWKIEKATWGGQTEYIWVDRTAPFVFKRTRNVGGKREFTSELLAYRNLQNS